MPPPPSNTTQVNSVSRLQMQLHLHGLQQNATDLRKQLTQLRKIQVNNVSFMKIHLSDISYRVFSQITKNTFTIRGI